MNEAEAMRRMRTAAIELNELMGLQPPIETEAVDHDTLQSCIRDAANMAEDQIPVTDDTLVAMEYALWGVWEI